MDMPKTVMIVDDSASLRQVVGIALKGAGYDVLEACDGKDALAKLDGRKINLVISDVNMPNLDGIGFVRQMKEKAAYKFTPVIMLTTEAGEAKKREGQTAGAKAWVIKPFQPQQMLDAVSRLVLP
jgi:two-component system chemotaxis response regulator CheY